MKIKKAVVTAGRPDQRSLPLQRLVDHNGVERCALDLIIEETVSAGVEQICLVIPPGSPKPFLDAAGDHAERLEFVEQDAPRGYGDALFRARSFVDDQAFLHLVGDHLYLSRGELSCARQVVDMAVAEQCSMTAVQPTREHRLPYFGAIGGRRVASRKDLYEVTTVLEKPTPTLAEQELVMAGLRSGFYLCVFGIHVLTPTIMELLEQLLRELPHGESLPLSPALAELAKREHYLAMEVEGTRHDIGVKYGLLLAQLANCFRGRDRDYIMTEVISLLADRPSDK